MAPRTGIVISESVDERIPNRAIMLNEKGFPQGNPDVVHNEESAPEILSVEILGLLDRFRMLV
jgi:hypothetical protein